MDETLRLGSESDEGESSAMSEHLCVGDRMLILVELLREWQSTSGQSSELVEVVDIKAHNDEDGDYKELIVRIVSP